MKKKWICALAAVFLFQFLWADFALGAFSDIRGHWAEREITDLQQKGIITGYGDGTFRPNREITRAEFAAAVTRAVNKPIDEEPVQLYSDVPPTYWAVREIFAAHRLGIMTGYSNGTFRPELPIIRAEAVVALNRSFPLPEIRERVTFPDVLGRYWAREQIELAYARGIINGDHRGWFYPERALTRAEYAVMLWQALERSNPGHPPVDPPAEEDMYTLELERWGVYNDGTHPLETTKGINEALKWAKEQGYTIFKVPAGTYVVAKGETPNDPEARINMVSEMTFVLDDEAVLKKEANGFEAYQLMYLGRDVHDAVLRGGTYEGDRLEHDYSKKDHPNSPGTHESGIGIQLDGARNVTIDGVRTVRFTGDGITIGGSGVGIAGLYEGSFEMGAVDDQGNLINSNTQIRTKEKLKLDHPIFETRRYITFWQPQKIQGRMFDVYFYDGDQFIQKAADQTFGSLIALPEGTDSVIPVFGASSINGVFVSFWSNDVSRNITIRNSESAENRRQGITIGGGDSIVIDNNKLHDISGTGPGYGIDVEGMGFFPNSNITITNNHFYNNRGDIVLADGKTARIEGNRLESRIGFHGWEGFDDVALIRNHFENTGLTMRGSGTARHNTIVKSGVVLMGTGITFEDAELTDASLRIDSFEPFGVQAARVTMHHNNLVGNALYLGTQPTKLTDVTIQGKTTLFTIVGPGSSESVYENLRVIDYNVLNGTNLPPGTYIGCYFESNTPESNGLTLNVAGVYVFDQCTFVANNKLMNYDHAQADITVRNSEFTLKGDVGYLAAVTVYKAKRLHWEKNVFRAEGLTSSSKPLVRFGGFAVPAKTEILEAVFEENEFISNLPVDAVYTLTAGSDAPPYRFKGNELINAELRVKASDVVEE